MTDRYLFKCSAAGPYAYLVFDGLSGRQVAGTVTRGPDGTYTYERSFWDRKLEQQDWDFIKAETLSELSEKIADYMDWDA